MQRSNILILLILYIISNIGLQMIKPESKTNNK